MLQTPFTHRRPLLRATHSSTRMPSTRTALWAYVPLRASVSVRLQL